MRSALITVTAAAALLAGCGGGTHQTATTPSPHTPAPATTSAAATPSPPPVSHPAKLTVRQAARAYVRIVDPPNRASDTVNTDSTDNLPFSQVRADILTEIRAWRTAGRQLGAIRWPGRVQPYVTAMRLTFIRAAIRCLGAEAAAGSNSNMSTVSYSNQDCVAVQSNTDADTIRSRLNLPPTG